MAEPWRAALPAKRLSDASRVLAVTSRLVYVANARLPTEKAHGYAIVKMCEAYANAGLDVELWHSRRHQDDPRLAVTTVFDFYDVPAVFEVRSVRNIDVIHAESWFPERLYPLLIATHDLSWGWYAARLARRSHAPVCHTWMPRWRSGSRVGACRRCSRCTIHQLVRAARCCAEPLSTPTSVSWWHSRRRAKKP